MNIPGNCTIVTRSHTATSSATESAKQSETSMIDEHPENDISNLQQNDPDIKEILKWVKDKTKPKWEDISHTSETCKYYWARFDSLSYRNEILYHKWESAIPKFQIVLPRSISGKVINEIHCNITGGHLGISLTLSKARYRFLIFGIKCPKISNISAKAVISVQLESRHQSHLYKNILWVPQWKDGLWTYWDPCP